MPTPIDGPWTKSPEDVFDLFSLVVKKEKN